MSTRCGSCGEAFEPTGPSLVAIYLSDRGWVISEQDAKWLVAIKTIENQEVRIEVPRMVQAADYGRRYVELLIDLAKLEGRSASQISRAIRNMQ